MKRQLNNLKALKARRKQLRNHLTPAEAFMWKLLQHSKLEGRKFRRQHSVGYYILDYYCPSEKLAIELDGAHHFTEAGAAYDEMRTQFLNSVGIRVIRFENKEVFEHSEGVLEIIKKNFITTPSLLSADNSPNRGGEYKRE